MTIIMRSQKTLILKEMPHPAILIGFSETRQRPVKVSASGPYEVEQLIKASPRPKHSKNHVCRTLTHLHTLALKNQPYYQELFGEDLVNYALIHLLDHINFISTYSEVNLKNQ